MATIESIIQAIQTPYSKGVSSDDSRLSNRYIYSVMLRIRKYLVGQQVRRRQKVSDWNYVVLSCIEMIPVESHECSCYVGPTCQIFRSKNKIPKILTSLNNHMVEFISTIDNRFFIDLGEKRADVYSSGNKYTSSRLRAVIENGYLYGLSENFPKLVKMKFIPEDPLEALQFEQFCDDSGGLDPCTSILDLEFPIDGDLEKAMVDLAGQEILNIFTQMPEDKTNNSSDSPIEQSK